MDKLCNQFRRNQLAQVIRKSIKFEYFFRFASVYLFQSRGVASWGGRENSIGFFDAVNALIRGSSRSKASTAWMCAHLF